VNSGRLRRALLYLVFLCAALIWLIPLLPRPGAVPFQPGALYSDLLISHIPNATFIRRSIQSWGQLPLWNPTILSGAPFAADPLAGMWYPPNWLAVLLPPALGFNLLILLHLAWGGLGMWTLMRVHGAGAVGALAAGLAFSGSPKLLGHFGLGHVTLVCAVCWSPWVLWATARLVEVLGEGWKRILPRAAMAGAALGLVFLIDPRWVPALGLLTAAYGLWKGAAWARRERQRWLRGFASVGVATVFAAGVAFVLALPLWEYLHLSTRASLAEAARSTLALPLDHLLEIVVPQPGGYAEWMAAPGTAVLLLAIVGIVIGAPGWGFWTGCAVLALILALGDQTPLYEFLSHLVPGMGYLRVPARMLFLFHLCTAILAGWGVDGLLAMARANRVDRRLGMGLGIGVAILLIGTAGALLGGASPLRSMAAIVSAGLIIVVVGWTVLSLRIRRWGRLVAMGWILIFIVDLGWLDMRMIETRTGTSTAAQARAMSALTQAIESQKGRIFSPSYSIPQDIAAAEGLELAEGVNPLQLATYWDFMASAVGFNPQGYSVTLPPFESGDPTQDWGPTPDGNQLGLLNVAWVVADYPVRGLALQEETAGEGIWIYRNLAMRPRAWIEAPQGETQGWLAADIVTWSPNRIVAHATGPGLLVISEVAYPGWMATVDGEKAEIQTVHQILRGIELGEGEHEVILAFRPRTVMIGFACTAIILAALIGMRAWR
jgi:hypothetical protein